MKGMWMYGLPYITFALCCTVAATDETNLCPPYNVTIEHLLEGIPHLRKIFDDSQPQGFLSAQGLRNLVSQLLLRTSCTTVYPDELVHNHLGYDGHKLNNKVEHHNDDTLSNVDREDIGHGHLDRSAERKQHGHDNESGHHHEHDNENHEHENNEHVLSDKGKVREEMIAADTYSERHSESEPQDSLLKFEGHAEDALTSKSKNCIPIEDIILSAAKLNKSVPSLLPHTFLHLCPSILNSLLRPLCHDRSNHRGPVGKSIPSRESAPSLTHEDTEHGYGTKEHNHHHRHSEGTNTVRMTNDTWIAAVLSMVLIGLIAFLCIMIIPILKKSEYYLLINHFLLAMAVGSLAGDALIHLLPHAITMETHTHLNGHLVHALYGFTAFFGILLFLLMERLHNIIAHRHSPGHARDTPATDDSDELNKEIGIISAELNEPRVTNFDRIGEKLSQHSKHSSFVYTDSASPSDPPRGCFESCPPNLGSGLEDPNGNSGNMDSLVCKSRAADHSSASLAERERLVVDSQPREKGDQISSTKTPLVSIPPPQMVQNSPPKSIIKQDSKNFNMVLQEYHVSHHGHSHHGHSHVTGKKDSLRTLILLGDGMHSFMDGMAIGAAFGTSLTAGIATAIAVLCHELPHKVGDFAILFEMGMRRRQAVKLVLALWVLSFLGLAVGVSIGSIHSVSPWIYCFTAGVFLYLALAELLPELSINGSAACNSVGQILLQVGGMITGAGIMLVIAVYEHDLESALEGAF